MLALSPTIHISQLVFQVLSYSTCVHRERIAVRVCNIDLHTTRIVEAKADNLWKVLSEIAFNEHTPVLTENLNGTSVTLFTILLLIFALLYGRSVLEAARKTICTLQ